MSEEALWNNSFYSSSAHISQSSSANHISTLRRSVALPHSTSSNSIAAGTLDGAAEKDVLNQRTSFMSASPSMKALESIMNGKEAPKENIPESIQEEEEPSPVPPASVFDKPAFNANYTYSGSRVSLHKPPPDASTSTFHTAKSTESVDASPERHRHSSSISTIGESGYSMGTPKLDPPASFYTVKRPTKDFSPQLLTVSGPRKNSESDQDTTAVEEPDYSTYPALSASTATLPQTKDLPQPPPEQKTAPASPVPPVKSLLPAEPEALQPPFQLAAQPAQTPAKPKTSATATGSPRPSPKKSVSANAVSKLSSSAFGTPKSSMSLHNDLKSERSNRPTQPSSRSPIRSSTMGDIHAAAERKPEPASKRFSFRGLFKKKSSDSPSKPAKLKAKSFSTPSFSALREVKEPKEPKEPKAKKVKEPKDKTKEHKEKTKEQKEPTKTKRKDKEKNLFAGFKRKKSDGNIVSLAEPEPKPSKTPQTPTTPGSFAEVDTPATNTLEPENDRKPANGNTIREVDDSDYNFEYSKNGVEDDSANIAADPPQRHAHENFGEELGLEPTDNLRLPEYKSDASFGSPLLKYRFNETPGSKPPQSNRSSLNPPRSDQLLGEALFPKSLNPHEIESIVSLERSRSMRSIKSNGKRSSYINYNGSDENVIVYSGEAGQSSPRSMKRAGSILKNSSSMSSLNGVVHSIDQAVADKLPSPVEAHETEELENPGLGLLPTLDFQSFNQDNFAEGFMNNDSENLQDFIEFSDFIDVDNLEFPSSPVQVSSPPREPSLPSVVDSGEFTFGSDLQDQNKQESAPQGDKNIQSVISEPNEETIVTPAEPIASKENGSVNEPDEEKPIQETQQQLEDVSAKNSPKPQDETQDSEPSLMIVDGPCENPTSVKSTPKLGTADDAITKSPILGTAYQMAMNEAVARESPSNVARPISMSFKGFKGPAISKQAIAKTGSHQSLNMYDSSNESSAVGQGFGSSDDESDEDIYSSEDDSENDIGHGFSVKKPAQAPGLKSTGNAANRGVPSPKMMGLQPPTGPFYHDRIPSLSDQSAASSPRSLTSFISRIKKSPMASPKVAYKPGGVRFSSRIILYDTYNGEEYDRHPDIATCNQLTPLLAQQIREELNEIKSEMEVHQDSQCYTHFF
ncbi:hypothetical protein CA3LBN_003772 [Candidozyma haemuli]|uniref:Protein BNI4 n=1 Tax=Candidozyma haemuli TaxID=45357 RepID=A0ABX8I841_9ASCO|nr:hypothetical protein CA3LBN_003772 [[Candida] haemuloni]